jgi:hypothetical protein
MTKTFREERKFGSPLSRLGDHTSTTSRKSFQCVALFISLCCILSYLFKDAPGKISFTADIWSNQSRYPYLAVMAHWIGRDKVTQSLHLKSALIAFHRLRGSHNGERIARVVLHILDRVGITVKVSLRNCSMVPLH